MGFFVSGNTASLIAFKSYVLWALKAEIYSVCKSESPGQKAVVQGSTQEQIITHSTHARRLKHFLDCLCGSVLLNLLSPEYIMPTASYCKGTKSVTASRSIRHSYFIH